MALYYYIINCKCSNNFRLNLFWRYIRYVYYLYGIDYRRRVYSLKLFDLLRSFLVNIVINPSMIQTLLALRRIGWHLRGQGQPCRYVILSEILGQSVRLKNTVFALDSIYKQKQQVVWKLKSVLNPLTSFKNLLYIKKYQ